MDVTAPLDDHCRNVCCLLDVTVVYHLYFDHVTHVHEYFYADMQLSWTCVSVRTLCAHAGARELALRKRLLIGTGKAAGCGQS
jgi:hypothetical protein